MNFKLLFSALSVAALSLTVISSASAKTFELDEAHSSVGFKIKHLGISTVNGHFDKFKGTLEVDDKTGELVGVEAVVDVKTVNTAVAARDNHLKSPDFFNVTEKGMDTMTFKSGAFKIAKGATGKMPGTLTIHGVPQQVEWTVAFAGVAKGMDGSDHAAMDANLEIKRSDYKLTWNKVIEAGGLAVGNEVKIEVNAEAAEAKAAPAAEKKPVGKTPAKAAPEKVNHTK